MSFDPFLRNSHTPAKATVENLQDVLTWVNNDCECEEATKNGYRGALFWTAKLARTPLSDIPADRDAVLAMFPDRDFSREWAKTYKAFRARKKNLSAAINGATGIIAEKAARRARTDGWRRLIERLRFLLPSLSDRSAALDPHKIVVVEALADLARGLEIDACDVTGETPLRLYRAAENAGQRKACEEAITLMNEVRCRDDGELMACLPRMPIIFARPKKPEHTEISKTLCQEIEDWVHIATRGQWSPTDEAFEQEVNPKPFRIAVRKVIRTAIAIEAIDSGSQTIAFAFADKTLTEVVRTWRKWSVDGDPRAIDTVTAKGYLERVKTFLERNGEEPAYIGTLLKTDRWLSSISGRSNNMSPRTQRFCRRVVRDLQVRGVFVSLHISYRNEAKLHLRKAKQFPADAATHLDKARKFGTIAAFAALMIDAAPLRIGSALPITFRGKDPWLNLGSNKKSDGHLFVPPGMTKNGKPISAPISAKSRTRGLEVLRWYETKIRPLYPHAGKNDFFFPGIQSAHKPLPYSTFKSWWTKTISDFGFPGMTPHMFRHGQASILVANNPGDWNYAMARLGDALSTCMDYYGWIDEERLILEGQNQLTRGLPNV
tara:strand:- start:14785 stop:16596 length:1812 start_codon:yes stop_codon:yes gene_type:complete